MKSVIQIDKLKVGYSTKDLILDFSASIEKGERIAILGLNGAGKSSLLKSLTGSIAPLDGEIYFHSTNSIHLNAIERARMIAQVSSYAENPGMLLVKDLIEFGRYPFTNRLNKLQEEDRASIEKAIESVGVQDLLERFFIELSDGEKQKVLLAAAIAQNTDVLILDEPTSHLDIRNKIAMMELIANVAEKEEKVILFTTHDLRLAKNVASRIWLIHDKKVQDIAKIDFDKEDLLAPLLEGLDRKYTNWF